MSLRSYVEDLSRRAEVHAVLIVDGAGEKFAGDGRWREILDAGLRFFRLCGESVPCGRFWGRVLRIPLDDHNVLIQQEGAAIIAIVFLRSHRFNSDVSRRIHSHAGRED